jgi:hypothetical protein
MTSQQLLLVAIILAVLMMAFVGIPAYVVGDPLPVLQLFLTAATPILTAVAVLLKNRTVDKTLEVSEQTDQKVDQLLNGSLQGKVALLETNVALLQNTAARNAHRISNIETVQIETLAEIRKLTGTPDEEPTLSGAD